MKGERPPCPACGGPLAGREICPRCGWDAALEHRRGPRRLRPAALAARLLLWSVPVLLAAGGMWRWVRVGPGPDPATTLRWLVLGDGGRAAELTTLNRAYEIARAASRFAVHTMAPPSLEGDWARTLAPYGTGAVRGWLPMLFAMADAERAPAAVRDMYAIRGVDGWGRPFRVRATEIPRGTDPAGTPEIAGDLREGLQADLFHRGTPDLAAGDWLRMELRSAGRDGRPGNGDDIVFVAYIPASQTLHLSRDRRELDRQLERAYLQGRVFYRIQGARGDLIDARLLAEHRLAALR